jgi:hypothetical protein
MEEGKQQEHRDCCVTQNKVLDESCGCVKALSITQFVGIGLFTVLVLRYSDLRSARIESGWLKYGLLASILASVAYYYFSSLDVEENLIFHLRALPSWASVAEIVLRGLGFACLLGWTVNGVVANFERFVLAMVLVYCIWDVIVCLANTPPRWLRGAFQGHGRSRDPVFSGSCGAVGSRASELAEQLRSAVRKYMLADAFALAGALLLTLLAAFGGESSARQQERGALAAVSAVLFLVAGGVAGLHKLAWSRLVRLRSRRTMR